MRNSQEGSEQLYATLKRDYDSLLQKNQNDLVKIRIKEKMLNEKIQQIQKQRQQQVQALTLQVQALKKQLQLRKATSNPVKEQDKQSEIHLVNQKLANSIKKYNELQQKWKSQQKEKQALKTASQQVQFLRQQIDILQTANERLLKEINLNQVKLSEVTSQAEINEQQIILMQQNNQKLNGFVSTLNEKMAQQAGPCQNCLNLQQQLQLQKQMVKSVRMMLKFKEMELQGMKK